MTGSSLQAAQARYREAAFAARRKAALNLQATLGVTFNLGEWSGRVAEAIQRQWATADRHPDGGFDWPEWFRRNKRNPDVFSVAIWIDQRLAGVALVETGSDYVTVKCVEGDPRPDCPLRGRRALIVMEAAACYAQALGKRSIRVSPVNDDLKKLYVEGYGFSEPRGLGYLVREI
ncbi:hypothetical protein [uncultured Alsobacter sp.]|uniref:hypothetical protein n=1 Tax=uncultured Alsobacter sp. TaxID=1748258 RepID=UPI0025E9E979|nr:hypothetical protein [uncultured Alsobacter sp.]